MFTALLIIMSLVFLGYYCLSINSPVFNAQEKKHVRYLLYIIDVFVYCSIPLIFIILACLLFGLHNVKVTDAVTMLHVLASSGLAFYGIYGIRNIIEDKYKIGQLSCDGANLFFQSCAVICLIIILGIFIFLLHGSLMFFQKIPIIDFLIGTQWNIAADVIAGNGGEFGSLPLLTGTIMIAVLSVLIAAPIGVIIGIYLAVYCPKSLYKYIKITLELVAGIPSVVYGLIFVISVLPLLEAMYTNFGIKLPPDSALVASIIMAVMIFPIIATLTDDVLLSIPKAEVKGALSMGATMYETVITVMIPYAMPGIISGIILAFSRVIGETMLMVMILGLNSELNFNPLKPVSTITVHIVDILMGEQSFDSSATQSVFALGLLLFIITLCLNIVARRVTKNFKEQYASNH